MALQSANTLKNNLLALPTTSSQIAGLTAFVDVIGDFMDQVQAGSSGSPGILIINRTTMVSQLSSLTPVNDNSWITPFANAWEAAILAGTVSAGTVTNPVWIGSGGIDTLTVPSAATTITTLATAKSTLISSLNAALPDSSAPLQVATAIRDATLALSFTCIGLGPPLAYPPIPLTLSAQ